MSAIEIVRQPSEAELQRYAEIICDTFAVGREHGMDYLRLAGLANVRILRRGRDVAGGLVLLPKGQYFGGVAVPMVGIAAVAVDPAFRGGRAGSMLMRATVEELHAQGVPISTLYPATVKLYRWAGYEIAGMDLEVSTPGRRLDVRDRTLEMRPATNADDAAIRACYETWAAQHAGNLQRTDFHWRRLRESREAPVLGHVVTEDGRIVGYAYTKTVAAADKLNDLHVPCLAATTPAALRRLLTLLSDFKTIRRNVIFRAGPADPLLLPLSEWPFEVRGRTPWMVRLIDVPKALAARGYSPAINVELHLTVRDDVLPSNDGRIVLRIRDGRGTVEPGGRGSLTFDVRGLAALYTGFAAPQTLVATQRAEGPADELAQAASAFAGPMPWMRDDF